MILSLSVYGTQYKEVEVEFIDSNKTIREIVADIVDFFDLPKNDGGGTPIQYLLGLFIDNDDEPEILEFEDDKGKEMLLSDYNIKSEDHLVLVSVPIAGGLSDTSIFDVEEVCICEKRDSHRHLIPKKNSFPKRIFNRIKGLFFQHEYVNATVFAPYIAHKGEVMTIQVLLYKDSQYATVIRRAKMVDAYAEEKKNQIIGLPIKKGDVLSVHCSFFTPNIDKEYIILEDNDKQVIWNSNIEDATFRVFIDERFDGKLLNGRVIIKMNDVPITEMAYSVRVSESKNGSTAMAEICATKYDKFFISYSHKDAEKVQYISETCRALQCDYFFDRHSLNPGDIYPDKIFKYIDNANLFILCWSENAATSVWVEKERKRAINNIIRGNNLLRLYPVCIPPKADLPDDMKEIFNFGELSYM